MAVVKGCSCSLQRCGRPARPTSRAPGNLPWAGLQLRNAPWPAKSGAKTETPTRPPDPPRRYSPPRKRWSQRRTWSCRSRAVASENRLRFSRAELLDSDDFLRGPRGMGLLHLLWLQRPCRTLGLANLATWKVGAPRRNKIHHAFVRRWRLLVQTSGLEFAAVTSNSFSNSFLTWSAATTTTRQCKVTSGCTTLQHAARAGIWGLLVGLGEQLSDGSAVTSASSGL